MCARHGCDVPVPEPRAVHQTEWDRDLQRLWLAREDAATAQARVGVKDRGKTYARQVWETVWVALAFGFGVIFGVVMSGGH